MNLLNSSPGSEIREQHQSTESEKLYAERFHAIAKSTLSKINTLIRRNSLRTNDKKPSTKKFSEDALKLLAEFHDGSVGSAEKTLIYLKKLDDLVDSVLITKEDHKPRNNAWTKAILEIIENSKAEVGKIQERVRRDVATRLQNDKGQEGGGAPIGHSIENEELEKLRKECKERWIGLASGIKTGIQSEELSEYFSEETMFSLAIEEILDKAMDFIKVLNKLKELEIVKVEQQYFLEMLGSFSYLLKGEEFEVVNIHQFNLKILKKLQTIAPQSLKKDYMVRLKDMIEECEEKIERLLDFDAVKSSENVAKIENVRQETGNTDTHQVTEPINSESETHVPREVIKYLRKSVENYRARVRREETDATWETQLQIMTDHVNKRIYNNNICTPQGIQNIFDRLDKGEFNVRKKSPVESEEIEKSNIKASQAWLRDVMEKHPEDQSQLTFEKKFAHAIWAIYNPRQIEKLDPAQRKALTSVVVFLRENSVIMQRPNHKNEEIYSFKDISIQGLKDIIANLLKNNQSHNSSEYVHQHFGIEENQVWMQEVMKIHPKKQKRLSVEKKLIHALWLYYKPTKIYNLKPSQISVLTILITALKDGSALQNNPNGPGKIFSFQKISIDSIEKVLQELFMEAETTDLTKEKGADETAENKEPEVNSAAGLATTESAKVGVDLDAAPQVVSAQHLANNPEQLMNEFLQQKNILESINAELAQLEEKLADANSSKGIDQQLNNTKEEMEELQKQLNFSMKNQPDSQNREGVAQWTENLIAINKQLTELKKRFEFLNEELKKSSAPNADTELLESQKKALEIQKQVAETIIDQMRPKLLECIGQ